MIPMPWLLMWATKVGFRTVIRHPCIFLFQHHIFGNYLSQYNLSLYLVAVSIEFFWVFNMAKKLIKRFFNISH